MSYENVNNFIVIEEDERNPDTSFANHRRRKPQSLGGVDCVAAYGTPIYAPDDCVIRNIPDNGSGGNTVQMTFGDGWIDQMMHLSEFVAPGEKRKRELIGYSGDSGDVEPHVHWHRIGVWRFDEWGSTNRYNPFHYFTSDTASTDEKLISEDEEMRLFWVGNNAYLQTPMGTSDPLTTIAYGLFYRVINSNQTNSPRVTGAAYENGVPQETFTPAQVQAMDEVLTSITRKALK